LRFLLVERGEKRAPPPSGGFKKNISQWCEPDEHTCFLRALAGKILSAV
jgi:hypothetical protein